MKPTSIDNLKDLKREKAKLALELEFHGDSAINSVKHLGENIKDYGLGIRSKIVKVLMIIGAGWIAKNHLLPKAQEIGAQIQSSETPQELMEFFGDLAKNFFKKL